MEGNEAVTLKSIAYGSRCSKGTGPAASICVRKARAPIDADQFIIACATRLLVVTFVSRVTRGSSIQASSVF